MTSRRLILIASSDQMVRARSYADQLQGEANLEPISIEVLDAEVVTAADLADAFAALIVADELRPLPCYRAVLRLLESAHIPVISLQNEGLSTNDHLRYLRPRIMREDCNLTHLAGFLCGLAHQAHDIASLRSELNLAQRYHGGLEGQIARIHEELQLASMIQREYLPRELPFIHGVEFAVMWRPTNYVSGDIYDVRRLDEDHVGIFVADAVGHGVPAALLTMIIARSLVTKETFQSSYRIVEPGEVLSLLNEQMIRCRGTTTRFVTAVYGVVNCRDRTVRMASAGHPPPILIQPDGGLQPLELEGSLLGVFEDEAYQSREFILPHDSRLLLYSDGFEQAFPSEDGDSLDRTASTQRYLDAFSDLADVFDADAIINRIEQRLDGELGSLHQVDDLTLLCVHAGSIAQGKKSSGREAVSQTAPRLAR